MSGTISAGKLILTDTQGNADAFDRLRVSNTLSLYEIHSAVGKMADFIDEYTSGSGTSTHNSTNSYVSMALANTGVGKVVRQTFEYIPYQPGKSRMMIFSGVLEASGGVANCIARIGCFDSTTEKTSVSGTGNGLFFELNGTTMYVVERLNDTDTKVAQSSWNVDVFDGNGVSGLTITDWSKAFIFVIDQEWLGVGSVRFGFMINGTIYIAHRFNHSGVGTPSSTAITYPYTKTAKLPIRYEISSSSALTAEMRMICSTVMSEGGFEPIGHTFAYTMSSAITISSASTFAPIISLRLKLSELNNRVSLLLRSISILNTGGTNNYLNFRLYILPSSSSLTGASWTDVATASNVQYDVSSTAVSLSGAYMVSGGYIDVRATNVYPFETYVTAPKINSNMDGSSRVLCITGIKVSSNIDVYASVDWVEIQ